MWQTLRVMCDHTHSIACTDCFENAVVKNYGCDGCKPKIADHDQNTASYIRLEHGKHTVRISSGERRINPAVVLPPATPPLPHRHCDLRAHRMDTYVAKRNIELVVVGASIGGINVLNEFLREFPADFSLPILIVQHMPNGFFTGRLAKRLDTITPLRVREARGGEQLRAGHVWFAPGDWHLKLASSAQPHRLALGFSAPEQSCRPSANVLFRSAAATFGAGVLGVVMTGMGKDGLSGCEEIKKRGGRIIVQDEASSAVWGMPGTVAKAGLADAELSPKDIAREIIRLTKPEEQKRGRVDTSDRRVHPVRGALVDTGFAKQSSGRNP